MSLEKFANRWSVGALLATAIVFMGCGGGNGTKAGITISAASATTGASSVTIPVNGTEQFAASVVGISQTTVLWQVCLPSAISTKIPTNCTTIPGVTPAKGTTPLSGYGTISQTGFYTAPSAVPAQNNFVILATSPADPTAFATFGVIIDSGIRVTVSPSSATIGAGEHLQLTATVTGATNTSVTWEVAGIAGGNSTVGFICPGAGSPQPCTPGEYFAPASGAVSQTITALSGADGTTTGTALISIAAAGPTLTSIEPRSAAQGSVEQQVYLAGTNFTSNGSVMVGGNSVPYIFLGQTLLRALIPGSALQSAAALPIAFQTQSGGISATQNLSVISVRPAIVAATPQAFSAGATPTVNLTGGYFSQGAPATATTVQFDGTAVSPASVPGQAFSRQMQVTLPAPNTPGLYALTLQNPGVAVGQPNLAGINIAVTPTSTPGAAGASVSVGAQPLAIAVDLADGLAVVTEQGANAVAILNLSTNPPTVAQTIAVGSQPSGVAVDDLLGTREALVVNSGSNTVSVIGNLATTPAVTNVLNLTGLTPTTSRPVAIGVNPQTHRAFVANASTNLGTVIDLVQNDNNSTSLNCTVRSSAAGNVGCPVMTTIGGGLTGYGTGANPAVGIDPSLNWAVVTPGGAGPINLVDLGFGSQSPGSGGRAPRMLGTLSISTTIQGVAINPETHTALFTDSFSGAVTEFSLLDNTVNAVTSGGNALPQQVEIAAAVNPLENVGIAINNNGGTASVIDLGNHVVITPVTLSGGVPSAVAIDPATNEALIVNSPANSVSVVSLTGGTAPKPVQILELSPAVTFTSNNPLPITITGTGFAPGVSVLLDNTALPSANVAFVSSRLVTATVPTALLNGPRGFAVQVQNSSGPSPLSNVEPLTIVQAIPVGVSPAGVAVDVNRDAALVTNSGDQTVSVISLASPAVSPESLGAVGVIGAPLAAHANPRGVAVDSRLGLGVVANYDSNDVSLVDYSGVFSTPYSLPAVVACPGSTCTGPAGVAFNDDTGAFLFTDSNVGAPASDVSFGSVTAPVVGAAAKIAVSATPQTVDQTPGDLAIAAAFNPANPALTYAAIASAAQTSVVDFLDTTSQLVVGRTNGVAQPSSVFYDWLNNVFLVSDSLANNIMIVDPVTFIPTVVRGGFNPATVAYNPQTSTIGTVNGITGTVSVLDYLCPPSAAAPSCTSPHVRAMIGQLGSPVSPTAPLGAKTFGIDPRLNLGVLVDPQNNRVLLIPLPH